MLLAIANICCVICIASGAATDDDEAAFELMSCRVPRIGTELIIACKSDVDILDGTGGVSKAKAHHSG